MPTTPFDDAATKPGLRDKIERAAKLKPATRAKSADTSPAQTDDDPQRWPLPDGWRWMRLGDVASVSSKQIDPASEPHTLWNYIGLENVVSKRGTLTNFTQSRGSDIGSAKISFQKGNILYAKLRPYLQKVYLANFDGISSTDLIPLVPGEALNENYLKWFLLGPDHLEYIQPLMSGINLPRLRRGDIENMPLPLPPLETQRELVARIEALFERVARAREALAAVPGQLEQLRQSVLAAAFRGDLTRAWREANPDAEPAEALLERIRAERRARFIEDYAQKKLDKLRAKNLDANKPLSPKDEAKLLDAARREAEKKYQPPEPVSPDALKGLPELPQGWAWAKLDELFWEVKNGISTKPDGENGAPILRISAVRPMKVDYGDVRYLKEWECHTNYAIQKNDILFTRYNGSIELVGACALVKDEVELLLYPDKIIRCRCADTSITKWIEIATSAIYIRNIIENMAKSTSGQTGISGSDLKSLIIPIPLEDELAAISSYVDQLLNFLGTTKIVNQLTTQLDQLEQSILNKAFRGELGGDGVASVAEAVGAVVEAVAKQGSLFEP